MRKVHIAQFREMIKTLNDACQELRKLKDDDFLNLCAEMQDFVSGIYDYMKSTLSTGERLPQLVQAFYEMLYHVASKNVSVKRLRRLVYEIETEILSLSPDKIEIAFFCYKASMSDSLESIYLAAKEDPACDAYFIPIPYFDRNPDGSLGQMHLEGTGYYSSRYELTDWKSYDVESRRPDVIFIMNPYDGQNYVTSVHPDFYSSRLKDCTDMLVYIEYGLPYWLYRDPHEPELEEEFKNKGNILPAHLHAHCIITYSKELAEAYQPLFAAHLEIMQHYGVAFRRDAKKIIALGSPKFDKVVNTRREACRLPETWAGKIAGKKVILYNTSLSELLKADSYFEKMRSIMDVFRERDDVILWWRPHPLFSSTLHSMRPAMLQEYREILQDFMTFENGIFDDTGELHRAIAYSDGMISDESSLLFLYAATGKPFYIPSISMALPQPIQNDDTDFHMPLEGRLANMRASKGANVGNWNLCIWWHNFLEEDIIRNIHFKDYPNRFIDFILHREKYSEAEEYKELQIQMIRDFVVNADGTAGQKIYEFVRTKAMEAKNDSR